MNMRIIKLETYLVVWHEVKKSSKSPRLLQMLQEINSCQILFLICYDLNIPAG